jgi:anti-sigma factor RsiW
MNCDEIDELLSDFIDDELAAGVRAGVEAHLAGCERCAGSHRKLLRTVRFVRSNARTPLVPGTPGGAYADFSRALIDESYGRRGTDVIRSEGFPVSPEEGSTQ